MYSLLSRGLDKLVKRVIILFKMTNATASSSSSSDSAEEGEPPSSLAVKISSHLKKLAKNSVAIQKQFFPSSKESQHTAKAYADPLKEDEFIKTKGLVHKYPGRVLIELTLTCASYCRFCTRRRKVSDFKKGSLSKKDIENMIHYLKSQPKINEVIFSGGDPLTAPKLLIYALKKFSALKQLKIIRVHTRVPVSNPRLISEALLQTFSQIKNQAFYFSIHFEHPDELSPPTVKIIKALRRTGAILLSQSVFLKGVNDSYRILKSLFRRLPELGIRPYYIYRCDPVKGAEHFIVPFKKEIEIMTKLRKNLSGLSCPAYVIDAPRGAGKIPVPLNFWQFNRSAFRDFKNKKIKIH